MMPFLNNLALVTCACLAISSAIPLQGLSVTPAVSASGRLSKRTNPKIGKEIDVNDPARGGKLVSRPDFPTSGAFSNAQQLLASAVFSPGMYLMSCSDEACLLIEVVCSVRGIDSSSPIFTHYFLEEHRDKVKKVMLKLLGNPATSEDVTNEGADELGQITFQGIDTPNNDDDAGCDKPGTAMYTEYYDTGRPVVVVCEDAWYAHDLHNTS